MIDRYPPTAVFIPRPSLYRVLAQFPVVCFTGTLITDLAYWRTADMQWANFSAWLNAVGLAVGAAATVIWVLEFIISRHARAVRPGWLRVIANLVVVVLALLDAFVHSRDAWTSVVPEGLLLSAAVVVVMILTGLLGRRTYRTTLEVA